MQNKKKCFYNEFKKCTLFNQKVYALYAFVYASMYAFYAFLYALNMATLYERKIGEKYCNECQDESEEEEAQ